MLQQYKAKQESAKLPIVPPLRSGHQTREIIVAVSGRNLKKLAVADS